jgi:hypothetical protein
LALAGREVGVGAAAAFAPPLLGAVAFTSCCCCGATGFVWLPDATGLAFTGLVFAVPAEVALVASFWGVAFSAGVDPAAAGPLLAGLPADSAVLDRLPLFGAVADASADGCFPSAAGGVSSLGSTPLIVSSAMLLPPRHAAMITSAEPRRVALWRLARAKHPRTTAVMVRAMSSANASIGW